MDSTYVITIGRQLGSGGKLIGEILSQKLSIPCYDRELILLASKESGLSKEYFEKVDEKSSFSFMGHYLGFRSPYMGNSTETFLRNETFFKIQSDVIRIIAEKESCIFVGRCADYILRNHPRCIKIFICAHPQDRIARLVEYEKITEKEAKIQLEQIDKKRAAYYNYYSNKTWGMATSYDLCINSSILGIEETSKLIENYIRKRVKN